MKSGYWASAWGVLMLFLIPVGGGIPGGVLLARSHGISWPVMSALYFLSDVILAFTFEPLMRLMLLLGKRFAVFGRMAEAVRRSMRQTASCYGSAGGPLALILIAFGVDPMTGRTAAAAAGHGFISGWTLAITGDMFYFWVIMVSTLWLSSVLGNGTTTMAVIMVAMFVAPILVKKWRQRHAGA